MTQKQEQQGGVRGYQKGFKIDLETGKREYGEYSYYLEQVELVLQKLQELTERGDELAKQDIPGREHKNTLTYQDIIEELEWAESILAKEDVPAHRRRRLEEYIKAARIDLEQTGAELGFPELIEEINTLRKRCDELLNQERAADQMLRHMPPEQMADRDV